MEMAQLEAFVRVAQERSFTGAAKVLYLSQSTISVRMAALERDLGVALFVRKGRHVELTEAGAAFLPYARKTVEMVARARAAARSAREGQEGHLIMGCSNLSAPFVIPRLLPPFVDKYPHVAISIRSGSSRAVRHLVLDGLVEFGIVTEPSRIEYPGLKVEPLIRDGVVWVVGPKHPLAGLRVEVADLLQHRMVAFDPQSGFNRYMDHWFSSAQAELPVRVDCDDFEILKLLLYTGHFFGILPQSLATVEVAAGRLHLLSVMPEFNIDRSIHLMTPHGARLSVNARRCLQLLRQAVAGYEYP